MSAPVVTLKSLTSAELTLNDLASIAADALAAINAKQQAWRDNAKRGGYASHFRDCPSINDELHMALLEEIVFFDDDAKETLSELRFQNEPTERDYTRLIAIADEQWDYYVAQGVKP